MDINNIPNWILALENEDLEFIKNFVLHSGSLKEIAKIYEVSYPTVRLKLDRLIDKIKMNDAIENEEFIKFIKSLSIDDRISVEDAKLIIEKYKQERDEQVMSFDFYGVFIGAGILALQFFFSTRNNILLGSYITSSLY